MSIEQAQYILVSAFKLLDDELAGDKQVLTVYVSFTGQPPGKQPFKYLSHTLHTIQEANMIVSQAEAYRSRLTVAR